mgnify:CR=1 FL=1
MIRLLLVLSLGFSSFGYSQGRRLPQVHDIGVLGLYSHDLFAWDRDNEKNTENSRLDLSTIFDWEDGSRINKGGNPKNSENAPVYSITMKLVDYYKDQLKVVEGSKIEREALARKATVVLFHQ